MSCRPRIAWIVVWGLLFAPAQATVLVPAEFREIVNGSDIIAFGRVVDVIAERTDGRSRIDTLVTLEVSTYLKGGPGETVVFRVPGGQLGRYRNVLVGAPIFEVGDETVVFLRARGTEYPTVFGLNQGVFRVRVDARTRRRIVVPPALMGRSEVPETVVRGSTSRQSLPLESFGAQVRTVMTEAGRGVQ